MAYTSKSLSKLTKNALNALLSTPLGAADLKRTKKPALIELVLAQEVEAVDTTPEAVETAEAVQAVETAEV